MRDTFSRHDIIIESLVEEAIKVQPITYLPDVLIEAESTS
jgi:hypothetical protein